MPDDTSSGAVQAFFGVGSAPVNNPGNLRPVGASTGFQQNASPEQGLRSVDDNLRAYGEKHGINTLRGVIERWAPRTENDTDAYVRDVASRAGINPDQRIDLSDPIQRHVLSAAIITHEQGPKSVFKAPAAGQAAPAAPAAQAEVAPGGEAPDWASPDTVKAFFDRAGTAPEQTAATEDAAASKPFIGMRGGINALKGRLAARSPDELAPPPAALGRINDRLVEEGKAELGTMNQPGAVADIVNRVGVADMLGAPVDLINAGGRLVDSLLGTHIASEKPYGGSENINDILEHFGAVSGTRRPLLEGAAGLVLPAGAAKTAKIIGKLTDAVKAAYAAETAAATLRESAAERLFGVSPARANVEQAAQAAQPAAMQPGDLVGVGAAASSRHPLPKLTGEESARREFPIIKFSQTPQDVEKDEQAVRAAIASEVVGDLGQVRSSVVKGNPLEMGIEHFAAAHPDQSPFNEAMRFQIAKEQQAISRYAEGIVRDTGSDMSMSDYERGERVNGALAGEEGLKKLFANEKEKIFLEAQRQHGDNPVAADGFEKNVLDNVEFQGLLKLRGLPDFIGGLKDLYRIHKTTGLALSTNKGDVAAPGSLAGLWQLRKNMNAMWSPENKHFIGEAVKWLDNDIAAAGGPGLYKAGNDLVEFEHSIMDAKGIKTLFGDIPANGIKRGTPNEKLMDRINALEFDEWRNIHDTLKSMASGSLNANGVIVQVPEKLRQTAESALAEIKGQLARSVYEAGAGNAGEWSAEKANNVLNKPGMAEKIRLSLDPELYRRLHVLNDAGWIMPARFSYPGAAIQGQQLTKLEQAMEKLSGVAGAGLAELGAKSQIPGMAGVGARVGEKIKEKTTESIRRSQAQKAVEEMQKNFELGKTKLQDIGK